MTKQRISAIAVTLIAVAAVLGVMFLTDRPASEPVSAATVNGVPIAMKAYSDPVAALEVAYGTAYAASERTQRMLELKKLTLDRLIDLELARQLADEAGVKVSESELNDLFTQVRDAWGDDEAFAQSLTAQGMTEDTYRSELELQLILERYLDKVAGNVSATDAEARASYDANAQAYTDEAGNLKPFSEVQEQIRSTLTLTKRTAIYRERIEKFRGDSKITVYVKELKDLY